MNCALGLRPSSSVSSPMAAANSVTATFLSRFSSSKSLISLSVIRRFLE
jgi:hypothetical protein